MIFLLTAFCLLGLEELLYRLHRGSTYRETDLAGSWMDTAEQTAGRLTLMMRSLRMVQLLVFCMIFAVVATSSGFDVLFTVSGQLAGLVLLLQFTRILTRKVINRYSVLCTVVILQVVLLGLLLFWELDAGDQLVPVDRSMDWLMSALAFAVLFQLSVAFSFSCTYVLRYFSREGSSLYYFMPPLAFSEYWAIRLIRVAALTSVSTLLLQSIMFVHLDYPIGSALLQVVLLIMLITALVRSGDRTRLHHPSAVILGMTAWSLNLVWVLAGFSATSGSWIV